MAHDEQWLLEEKYAGQETAEYETDRKRLASGEPLGYVIGWQSFCGLKIHLDSRPLIPRPETEWWTEQLIIHVGTWYVPTLRFLDLCAGSGAIGCAVLSKLPNAQVSFGEIDKTHEATILKNIRENNLDGSRADVRIGNLFQPFGNMKFSAIAINPPYIPADRALPKSVADYEPANALRAGADGLSVIRRIAKELSQHLAPDGQVWIECDSPKAEAARALFEENDLSASIHTDQYGAPRVIVVHHYTNF